MPITKINIEEFISLAQAHPVLDVRSPGEYTHAHIPGAHNLPLFTDEQRKIVGTAYKQQNREVAIKIGLDHFGPNMRSMVEAAEKIMKERDGGTDKTFLVHCWRGGMRSAGVAWLLDLYGFKIYVLAGGYKAYRNWVLQQFVKEQDITLIGGYTGSGKTKILHQLNRLHRTVIDLEDLAKHKGSAFGALQNCPQPTQEMFENLLAMALHRSAGVHKFIEDESQRIGNLQIPMPFWYQLRKCPMYFLDVPFEERLKNIVAEYSGQSTTEVINAIIRIQKRLGGLSTKNAINFILEKDHYAAFAILLKYYDKYYEKALNDRDGLKELVNKIPCTSVDIETNIQKILSCEELLS